MKESGTIRHPDQAVITGAFSFTGRYVARLLLDEGVGVRTLTRDIAQRKPLWRCAVEALSPGLFADPDRLRRSMEGANVLYNTYWIRLGLGKNTFEQAVENSRTLLEAAAQAGVGRVVHFSVANASTGSKLPYFRGKEQVEGDSEGHGYTLTPSSGPPWSSGSATCC